MIRHIWTVLCSRSITDKDTNNISLLDVIEGIQLQVKKGTNKEEVSIPFPFQWVTFWAREKGEEDKPTDGRVKDIVLGPSGKIIFTKEYEVDLSQSKRTRFVRNFQGMPAPDSGQYTFRTQVRNEHRNVWEDVSEVPLEVSIAE
jgi:hypothetical protein